MTVLVGECTGVLVTATKVTGAGNLTIKNTLKKWKGFFSKEHWNAALFVLHKIADYSLQILKVSVSLITPF